MYLSLFRIKCMLLFGSTPVWGPGPKLMKLAIVMLYSQRQQPHKTLLSGNFNCFYKDIRHLLKRLKEPRICIAPTRPYPRKPFCRTTFCSANQVVLIQTNFNRTQEARSDVLDRYWITTFWAKFAIGRFDEILFEQATPNNLADRLKKYIIQQCTARKKSLCSTCLRFNKQPKLIFTNEPWSK